MWVLGSSYPMLYELAGRYNPHNGNCKREGERLRLSEARQDCHRSAVAAAAAVDSSVGSDLSSYRQIHLIYIVEEKS